MIRRFMRTAPLTRKTRLLGAGLLSLLGLLVAPPVAMADDTPCVGVLTGTFDNVVVPPGAICFLNNSLVRGNVTALENSRLTATNNTVAGNMHGDKAEFVDIRSGTVSGDIHIHDGEVQDSVFDVVILFVNLPNGNIKVEKMVGNVGASLNRLGKGNIQFAENVVPNILEIRFNTVAQNLQVYKNRGTGLKAIQFNTVGENLQCTDNDPPVLGQPNTVGGNAEGQCGQP